MTGKSAHLVQNFFYQTGKKENSLKFDKRTCKNYYKKLLSYIGFNLYSPLSDAEST
jgi:hypothetical protein